MRALEPSAVLADKSLMEKQISLKLEPEIPIRPEMALSEAEIEAIAADPNSPILEVKSVKKPAAKVEFVVDEDDLADLEALENEAQQNKIAEEPAPKKNTPKPKEFTPDENGIFDLDALLASSIG